MKYSKCKDNKNEAENSVNFFINSKDIRSKDFLNKQMFINVIIHFLNGIHETFHVYESSGLKLSPRQ